MDISVLGLSVEKVKFNFYIVFMGIYVFKKEVLYNFLEKYEGVMDFGKEIIFDLVSDYNL